MIRVFPRRTKWTPTDELAFVGDPPLIRPKDQPVRISVTFTWDIDEGKRLEADWSQYYPDTVVGGPAFDNPGDEFTPGMFVKPGVTVTSRGCPKKCPWCFVPIREGALRELEIKEGHIIIDNNLLACSERHLKQVFLMLGKQRKAAQFKGGLDATLLKPWHRLLLDSIRVDEMFFACDTPNGIGPLEMAANILRGISIEKKRCFVMIGYGGESLKEAEWRLETVYKIGFLPFAQLYRDTKNYPLYGKEWRDLSRKWSRPAAYRKAKI